MQKSISLLLILLAVFTQNKLISMQNCSCVNCHCTVQSHCGCMENISSGCSCSNCGCTAQENCGCVTGNCQCAGYGNFNGCCGGYCGCSPCNHCGCYEGCCSCDSYRFPAAPIEDCCDPYAEWYYAEKCQLIGIWLPEEPPLFRPFIADPRQICYSVGWRFNDQALAENIGDVSFGDSLPIYEWFNVWPWCGKMRIDIEGGLWAVFAHTQESAPLINADYYVGIPVTYAFDDWSFRLRFFHISSHIGDEFLIKNLPRGFDRKNPSAEYLDFAVSNQFTRDIRLYGLLGGVLHQDESFRCGRFYLEAGFELRPQALRYINCNERIYGVPFLAAHFRYKNDFKRHLDATYALGYEWGKMTGLCHRVRIYMEYHDGYSVEGQFCKVPTSYFSIRASYGF